MSDAARRILEAWREQGRDGGPLSLGAFLESRPDLTEALVDWLTSHVESRGPRLETSYRDFEFVGEGGQGFVYRAEDEALCREVAFKVIRSHAMTWPKAPPPRSPLSVTPPADEDPELERFRRMKQRFLQEALIAGGLAHPGILPVYELGETPSGVPYYTMRLVRGDTTLATRLAELTGKGVEDRLGLLEVFLKVCDAIEHAHARGVVHRDLKPLNVAVGEHGEVAVLDWGLASVRGDVVDKVSLWQDAVWNIRGGPDAPTAPGPLGTPGYMPPEAAKGDVAALDERGDVYSLGAILFEILTGQIPFPCEDVVEYIRTVSTRDPPSARSVEPSVPGALSDLCASALCRDPAERLADVGSLAAGVRGFQASTVVDREVEGLLRECDAALRAAEGRTRADLRTAVDQAALPLRRVLELRPGHRGAFERQAAIAGLRDRADREEREAVHLAAQKRFRRQRRRLVRVLVGATAGVVLVVLGVSIVLISGEKRAAEEAAERAEASEAVAQVSLGATLSTLAEGLVDDGRYAAGQLAAARAATTGSSARTWRALSDAGRRAYRTYTTLSRGLDVRAMACGPGCDRLFAGCSDGRVYEWSLTDGHLTRDTPAHEDGVTSMALSADGSRLYTGGAGQVRVWDVAEMRVVSSVGGFQGAVHSLEVSRDGRTLVCADSGLVGGSVHVLSTDDHRRVWRLDCAPGPTPGVAALTADGRRVVVGTGAHVVVWSLDTRRPEAAFTIARGLVTGLSVPGDRSRVYVSSSAPQGEEASIELWDWASGSRLRAFGGVEGGYEGTHLSPDRRVLWASRRHGNVVEEWRLGDAPSTRALIREGHLPIASGGSSERLIVASRDVSLRMYEAGGAPCLASLRAGHSAEISHAATSADGRWLVTAGADGRARTWDLAHRRVLGPPVVVGPVAAVAVTSGATPRIVVTDGEEIRRLDASSGALRERFKMGIRSPATSLALAPQGDDLLVGCQDGSVWWHGSTSAVYVADAQGPMGIAREGAFLVTSDEPSPPSPWLTPRVLALWQLRPGGLPKWGPPVLYVDVANPSSTATLQLAMLSTGFHGSLTALTVDATGDVFAAGGEDGRIEVWNLVRGKRLAGFRAFLVPVASLALIEGGTRVHASPAPGDESTTLVHAWDLDPVRPAGVLEGHTGPVTFVAAVQEDRDLVTVSASKREILVWREAPRVVRVTEREKPDTALLTMALSEDGRRLFAGYGALGAGLGASDVVEWDLKTRREVRVLDAGLETAGCNAVDGRVVRLSKDGNRLYSGAWSSHVALLQDLCPPKVPVQVKPELVGGEPGDPSSAPRTVKAYRLVKVLDTVAGAPERSYLHASDADEYVLQMALSEDDSRLYVAGRTGAAYEYDCSTRQLLRRFQSGAHGASALALSPSTVPAPRRRLFLGTRAGEVQIWALGNLTKPLDTLRAHEAGVGALLVSCDGSCLFTAAGATGHYDEDSRLLETQDTSIRRWDLAHGSLRREYEGHEDYITCLALAGDLLFSGSLDGTIRVWDGESGEALAVLDCMATAVHCMTLSSDGSTLYCGTGRGELVEWELEHFLGEADARATRVESDTGLRLVEDDFRAARKDRLQLVEHVPSAFATEDEPARR